MRDDNIFTNLTIVFFSLLYLGIKILCVSRMLGNSSKEIVICALHEKSPNNLIMLGSLPCTIEHTVFIRTSAAALIKFSVIRVRRLIEGVAYLKST